MLVATVFEPAAGGRAGAQLIEAFVGLEEHLLGDVLASAWLATRRMAVLNTMFW